MILNGLFSFPGSSTQLTIKGGSTPAVATDTALVVTPLPLTKGVQGTTGVMVQNFIDAGRVNLVYSANGVAPGATGVETAITMACSADTGTRTSASSFVITSGKIFRITSIMVGTFGSASVTQVTTFHLRINSAGAVTTSSNVIFPLRTSTYPSSTIPDRVTLPLPDGLEYTGNGTVQFGVTANSVYASGGAPTLDVVITGFEY